MGHNWERAFNADTRKETHDQMQRAYLKGQRRPLPVTSVDIKSWIKEGFKHERSEIERLVSGEEVLAKIDRTGEATSFDKLHIIIPIQAKGIALMPWCL